MIILKYFFITLFVVLFFCFTAKAATLKVHIENLRNDNGQVIASLFNKKDGFPRDKDAIIALEKSNALHQSSAILTFQNLDAGFYAVAIMHDESLDDDMDYNLIGIPKEGYCFSNNVKPKLAAPRFDETKVWVESDTTIFVQMKYWGDK
jgi:uncharacterized protein (DUF2141 family)